LGQGSSRRWSATAHGAAVSLFRKPEPLRYASVLHAARLGVEAKSKRRFRELAPRRLMLGILRAKLSSPVLKQPTNSEEHDDAAPTNSDHDCLTGNFWRERCSFGLGHQRYSHRSMQLSSLLHVLLQFASSGTSRTWQEHALLPIQYRLQGQQRKLRRDRPDGSQVLAGRRSGWRFFHRANGLGNRHL